MYILRATATNLEEFFSSNCQFVRGKFRFWWWWWWWFQFGIFTALIFDTLKWIRCEFSMVVFFSHEYESEFKNEHSKSGRTLKSDGIKKPYFQINVERKIHISIDKDVHCTLAQKTRFEFHYSHFKWQLFLWHNKYNKLKATTAAATAAITTTTYNEKRGELL